jgi:bifunctional oligoribonuclease and PAP phosphatase NrnA
MHQLDLCYSLAEMESEVEELKELLESSVRVLITSHIAPDPDAVTSTLLVGGTLAENYPNKEVQMVLEERPLRSLDFLEGYDLLKIKPLALAVEEFEPDLMIIVDANSLSRVSRQGAEQAREYLKKNNPKLVILDHHEEAGAEASDVFINNKRPATAEEVYHLFFEQLRLKKPKGYAKTTLLGIISDTQRHRFDHPGYRETYRIVSDLLDAGASIEKLEALAEQYNKDELLALSHYAANITNSGQGYTYSFVGDDFIAEWQSGGKNNTDMKNACEEFANRYLKSFEGNKWGFVISPEPLSGPDWWGVSFRALSGSRDVAAIAQQLGGGGHRSAAGAKIQSKTVQEAIEQVIAAIGD